MDFLENKNTPLWAAVDVLSPTLHQRNYPIKVTPLQRLYYKSQHKLVCGSNTVLFSGFKKLTRKKKKVLKKITNRPDSIGKLGCVG